MNDRIAIILAVGTLAISTALVYAACDARSAPLHSPMERSITEPPSPTEAPDLIAPNAAASDDSEAAPDYRRRPTLPEMRSVEGRTEFKSNPTSRGNRSVQVRSAPSRSARPASPGSLNPMARQQPTNSSERSVRAQGVKARPVTVRGVTTQPVRARPVTVSR